MKTIDDALKYADKFDSPHNQHMSIVMLASEVRRLRDEVNGLTGSLDRAEKALKEAQEQEPVAYRIDWPLGLQELGWQPDSYDEDYVESRGLPNVVPLYAAPVPAVAAGLPAIGPYRDFIPAPAVPAPSVPEEWRESTKAMLLSLDEAIRAGNAVYVRQGDKVVNHRHCWMRFHEKRQVVDALLQSSQSAPAVAVPAVHVLGADDQLATLMRFYQVSDIPSLALAQAKHVERLQAKLPAMRDDMPRNPRGA